MADTRLDQIVKGAPGPSTKLPSIATRDPAPLPPLSEKSTSTTPEKYNTSDPLATLPSSPPQIYLNLLILECSLRSQYLVLRARRRLHSFFLLLLFLWNSLFTYLLFLKPREDGMGIGGSVYWFIEVMEKVALMGGILTGLLMWGTGQWERGVRWPRRWLHFANRGLRTMNTKIVVVKGKWWKEGLGHVSFLFPLESLIGRSPGSEWHYVEHSISHGPGGRTSHHHGSDEEFGIVEEDLAPGGDYIKLLLLPKYFSPEFRENWEEYRADYWEKENDRRSQLRQRLKNKKRQKAKQHGGWFWWTGLWRFKNPPRPSPSSFKNPASTDPEKHHHHTQRSNLATFVEKDTKSQRRRSLLRSDSTHSRASSRSSTPGIPDSSTEDNTGRHTSSNDETSAPRLNNHRLRRASSSHAASSGQRKKLVKKESGVSPLTKSENIVDEEGEVGNHEKGSADTPSTTTSSSASSSNNSRRLRPRSGSFGRPGSRGTGGSSRPSTAGSETTGTS